MRKTLGENMKETRLMTERGGLIYLLNILIFDFSFCRAKKYTRH